MSKHQNDTLKAAVSALRKKIDDTWKISDAGERLLAFTALQKACEGAYDPAKAKKRQAQMSDDGAKGAAIGAMGAVAGTAAAVIISGALTMGTAPLVVGGVLAIGGFVAGGFGGEKLSRMGFERRHSGEEKYATAMHEMNQEIDRAIEHLSSSTPKNLKALSTSPRLEDVKKEFPALVKEFNNSAETVASAEKLLQAIEQKPAADKKPGPKF